MRSIYKKTLFLVATQYKDEIKEYLVNYHNKYLIPNNIYNKKI